MKNKFNKYYLLTMQVFGTLLFCHMLMISGPFIRWYRDGEFSFELLLQFGIIMPLMMYVFCIAVGCYGIFQKVLINNEGIEIFFFKKSIKKVDWDVILSIEKSFHDMNPALKIELPNEEEIYLEDRKPIRQAIEFYSGKQIG